MPAALFALIISLMMAAGSMVQCCLRCWAQVFLKKLLRQEGARPEFAFKQGQMPEQVPSAAALMHRL